MDGLTQTSSSENWPEGLGTLRLADLLGALSHALDATEGQPVGHAIRVTLIGNEIGTRLGLEGAALSDLYYTLLLKDLGCSSNAARICQLYLADDQDFKQAFKLVDGSTRSALAFLVRETAKGASALRRAKTLVSVIKDAGAIVDDLIETRCQQGATIARHIGFSDRVAMAIHALDEHWDGSGRPDGLEGDAIPLGARIALVAQVADVFMTNGSVAEAVTEISSRKGTWFDPAVADVAISVLKDEAVTAQLAAPDLSARVFQQPAAEETATLTEDAMDRIIEGFSQVIDAKSPFTRNHSNRVALYAGQLAEGLGFDAYRLRWLGRAAMLHDIGKLGVPNRILDFPGRLSPEDRTVIEAHTLTGHVILQQIGVFQRVAHLAEAHHERLDGKGYPHGLSADELGLDVRVLTVADIFDALSAERPYKPALPLDEVHKIMTDMEGTAIDPTCYEVLRGIAAPR